MPKRLIGTFSLIVMLITIGFVLMDEGLDERAAATGGPLPNTVSEVENGYYALIALDAADGADGLAYAKAFVNESRSAAKDNRDEKQPAQQRATRPVVCEPQRTSYLNAVRDKANEFNKLLEAHKEDLARYQTLLAAKKFEEVLDFQPKTITSMFSGTALGALGTAQCAHLTQAALDLEAGNTEAAAKAVLESLSFYSVMLAGSRTGVGHASAITGYDATLAFAKDALALRGSALIAYLPNWQEAIKAASAIAPPFEDIFDTEFGAVKRQLPYIASAVDGSSWAQRIIFKLLYQPNATLNHIRRNYDEMTAAAKLPANEFNAAWDKIETPDSNLPYTDKVIDPWDSTSLAMAMTASRQMVTRYHQLRASNGALLKAIDAAIAAAAPPAVEKAGTKPAEKPDAASGKK